MKSVVFDSGPVISLTMNNLLWLLEPLKSRLRGDFFITEAVRQELVERPLNIRRFEFEALQVMGEIDCGTLKVVEADTINELTDHLLGLANNCFSAMGHNISIVHRGEMASLACALTMNADAVVIDERTTRELVEGPERIGQHMQSKMHTSVKADYGLLKQLKKILGEVRVLRSVELVAVAYEAGLLSRYIDRCKSPGEELKKKLLESVLWGVKMDGCAVSENEIGQIMRLVAGKGKIGSF